MNKHAAVSPPARRRARVAAARLAAAALAFALAPCLAAPKIAASILPLHSLAAGVAAGVAEPQLLAPPTASPHAFALRPSVARALHEADLVIWVGPALETFLARAVRALPPATKTLELATAPGLRLLPARRGGQHGHDDHGSRDDHDGHGGHDGHDNHRAHDDHGGHDAHDGHGGHDDHGAHDSHSTHGSHSDYDAHDAHNGHSNHDDHDAHDSHSTHGGHGDHGDHDAHNGHSSHDDHGAHGGHGGHDHDAPYDPHIWLDPVNARAIVAALRDALVAIDGANAAAYRRNAARMAARIDALDGALDARLAPARGVPYLAAHDAWQYFGAHFGVAPADFVTADPSLAPGAARLRALQRTIARSGARCLFHEPQLPLRLPPEVTRAVRVGQIDPLGVALAPGPDAWFALMTNLADDLLRCLAPAAQ